MDRTARLLLAAVFLAACSDSQSPPQPTTIVLSTSSVSFDAIGATQTVAATVNDQHGQPMSTATVAWTSSTAAATVAPATAESSAPSPSAVITAVLNGASTITATSGSAHATINVVTAQAAASLQKTGGDLQSGVVNAPLAAPLGVRVLDRLGVPVAGLPVTFAVTQGGGVVTQASASTGGDGIALTTWTLGKLVTQTQQATASAGTLAPVSFSATASAGAPKTIAITSGDRQTGAVGASLANAPQVTVTDEFSNPVSNATVSFVATGGSVATPQAATNGAGVATPGPWTLGTTPGTKSLAASAAGTNTVTLTATAVVGAAADLVVSGNNQTANAVTAVPVPPSVRVVDAFANPVAGVGVTFTVSGGGGFVTGTTQTSDAGGNATVGSWTLGAANGPNTLAVTTNVQGVQSRTIVATAVNGSGTVINGSVGTVSGGIQAGMAGQAVPIAPAVIVRDLSGTPMPNVVVTFEVASGGGSVTGATATTNSSGIATLGSWTLGTPAAVNTMTASALGYGSATFTAAGCEGGGGTGYAVTVCYRTAMTASQRQAFVSAANRWSSIVTSDQPDLSGFSVPEGACDAGTPSINIPIDDILIFAAIQPIDGVGAILGSAGWCFRRVAGLPVIGSMMFDVADVANLEATNRFGSVILHEMGHVLGIGTMWTIKGLLQNPSGASSLDTYFSGPSAIGGFNAIGGSTYTGGQKVPVENTGGLGTINTRWRESVLANELMTGFINSGSNPLSLLTVRSLEDLGYTVNAAMADPFNLTLSLRASIVGDTGGLPLVNDVYTGPQWTIDSRGRVTRIR